MKTKITGVYCVDEGKEACTVWVVRPGNAGIEVFGGYLPVYHYRQGPTKNAGDCIYKKGPSD